jgi:hypothetical protein
MSTGFTVSALRVAIVAIPAVLIVLFAGLVAALALVMKRQRREYALNFIRVYTDLAAVLVNGQRAKVVPERRHPKSVKN